MVALMVGLVGLVAAHATSAPFLVALVGGAVTVAAGIGGIAGFHAYKNAAAGWKEERDAAVAKADRLDRDLNSIKAQVAINVAEIKDLRAKDTTRLYDLIVKQHKEKIEVAARVEKRDQALAEKIGAIADTIDEVADVVIPTRETKED